MKIAITGKGGVGKTTFASMISRMFADEGYRVVAVDADPDANLALALGFPKDVYESIVPISEMKKLVSERTATSEGTFNKMFKLNPKVDDIPEKYCKEHNGVGLLTLGTVDTGGSGCVCPEHVLLKRLCSHLILQNKDVVVMGALGIEPVDLITPALKVTEALQHRCHRLDAVAPHLQLVGAALQLRGEIGRASCRERV